ncbi:hypothetical protein [Nostoc sp.]
MINRVSTGVRSRDAIIASVQELGVTRILCSMPNTSLREAAPTTLLSTSAQ